MRHVGGYCRGSNVALLSLVSLLFSYVVRVDVLGQSRSRRRYTFIYLLAARSGRFSLVAWLLVALRLLPLRSNLSSSSIDYSSLVDIILIACRRHNEHRSVSLYSIL